MGALSYQSLVNIDCAEYSETILQSTFYLDKNWETPAMATDTSAKPKKDIDANSTMQSLANMLCKE